MSDQLRLASPCTSWPPLAHGGYPLVYAGEGTYIPHFQHYYCSCPPNASRVERFRPGISPDFSDTSDR